MAQQELTKKDYIKNAVFIAAIGFAIYAVNQPDEVKSGTPTESLNSGYVACVSEIHLQQFNIGTHRMQVTLMKDDFCVPTANLVDYEYSVLGQTSFGVSQVRIFLPDDQYADLYVPREATMRSHADDSK